MKIYMNFVVKYENVEIKFEVSLKNFVNNWNLLKIKPDCIGVIKFNEIKYEFLL